MTPGVQSRNDTPAAADTFSATRHVGQLLGTGDGVMGRSPRLPVRAGLHCLDLVEQHGSPNRRQNTSVSPFSTLPSHHGCDVPDRIGVRCVRNSSCLSIRRTA